MKKSNPSVSLTKNKQSEKQVKTKKLSDALRKNLLRRKGSESK